MARRGARAPMPPLLVLAVAAVVACSSCAARPVRAEPLEVAPVPAQSPFGAMGRLLLQDGGSYGGGGSGGYGGGYYSPITNARRRRVMLETGEYGGGGYGGGGYGGGDGGGGYGGGYYSPRRLAELQEDGGDADDVDGLVAGMDAPLLLLEPADPWLEAASAQRAAAEAEAAAEQVAAGGLSASAVAALRAARASRAGASAAAGGAPLPPGACYCRFDADFDAWALGEEGCRAALYRRAAAEPQALPRAWLDAFYTHGARRDGGGQFVLPHEADIAAFVSEDCSPQPPCACAGLRFDGRDAVPAAVACCRDLRAACRTPFSGVSCQQVSAFCGDDAPAPLLSAWVSHALHRADCRGYAGLPYNYAPLPAVATPAATTTTTAAAAQQPQPQVKRLTTAQQQPRKQEEEDEEEATGRAASTDSSGGYDADAEIGLLRAALATVEQREAAAEAAAARRWQQQQQRRGVLDSRALVAVIVGAAAVGCAAVIAAVRGEVQRRAAAARAEDGGEGGDDDDGGEGADGDLLGACPGRRGSCCGGGRAAAPLARVVSVDALSGSVAAVHEPLLPPVGRLSHAGSHVSSGRPSLAGS